MALTFGVEVTKELRDKAQNPADLFSPATSYNILDVLTHPYTKSIVKQRWQKPGAASPPSRAHEPSQLTDGSADLPRSGAYRCSFDAKPQCRAVGRFYAFRGLGRLDFTAGRCN